MLLACLNSWSPFQLLQMATLEQVFSEIKVADALTQQLRQSFETLLIQFPPAVYLSHQWRNLQCSVDKIQTSLKNCTQELESKKRHLDLMLSSIEHPKEPSDVNQKPLGSDENFICNRCSTLGNHSGDELGIRISEKMDGKTLQMLLNDRFEEHELIAEEIYNELRLSNDPGKLVLDAMVGFFPPHLRKGNVEYEGNVVRRSCVLLLEQLLKMKSGIKKAVRKEARNLAGEWSEKMRAEGESSEMVLGFVLLLVVYQVSSHFEKDELRRLAGVIHHHRVAEQLRFGLGLLQKCKGSGVAPQIQKEEPDTSSGLCSLCKNMDLDGLQLYLKEHIKEQKPLHENILSCLRCTKDPANLVFDVMQDFLLEMGGTPDDTIKSRCDFMVEKLMKLPAHVAPLVKEEATNFARLWKARIMEEGNKPSQVFAFLKFLAAYGLASSFEEDELLSLFGIFYTGDDIYELEQNPSLCHDLGLEVKVPGLVQSLIEENERLVAVRYICAFNQVDNFLPVPLLREHLKYVKQTALTTCKNFKNSNKALNKCANRQILALQGVIKCITVFKLESQFSPIGLQQRIEQLEKQKIRINFWKMEKGMQSEENCSALNPTSDFQLESKVSMKMAIPQQPLQIPEKCPRVEGVQNVIQPTMSVATASNKSSLNPPSQGYASQCIKTTQFIPYGSSTWQPQQQLSNTNRQIQPFSIHGKPYGSIASNTESFTSLNSDFSNMPPMPSYTGSPASNGRYGLQYLYPPPP